MHCTPFSGPLIALDTALVTCPLFADPINAPQLHPLFSHSTGTRFYTVTVIKPQHPTAVMTYSKSSVIHILTVTALLLLLATTSAYSESATAAIGGPDDVGEESLIAEWFSGHQNQQTRDHIYEGTSASGGDRENNFIGMRPEKSNSGSNEGWTTEQSTST